MKAFRMLGRSIRDAIKSVIRNFSLSLASISCITITLIIVAVAIMASFNVQNFTKEIERDMTIVVFLDNDTEESDIKEIIVGGGGAYNKYLLELLKAEFEPAVLIKTHEDFGISNKFKEAIAFALLAYTSFYNIPNNVKTATGAVKSVVLGKIIRRSEDC